MATQYAHSPRPSSDDDAPPVAARSGFRLRLLQATSGGPPSPTPFTLPLPRGLEAVLCRSNLNEPVSLLALTLKSRSSGAEVARCASRGGGAGSAR